jgi:hypothetical protein
LGVRNYLVNLFYKGKFMNIKGFAVKGIVSAVLIGIVGCSVIRSNSSQSEIEKHPVVWNKIPDVAQYKGADWKNEVMRKSNLTVEDAKSIAESDPQITFFFYMKGYQMFLEGKPGPGGWTEKGVFRAGDSVFFTGKPWYGSAPSFSDAYEKE